MSEINLGCNDVELSPATAAVLQISGQADDKPVEVQSVAVKPFAEAPTFATVSTGYMPGRGLAGSFLVHIMTIAALALFSVNTLRNHSQHFEIAQIINLHDPQQILFLPQVGGGSEGKGKRHGGQGSSRKNPALASARSSKGYTYPGPQPVVSDPPRATNPVQTILRPALKKLRPLHEFVPLPNIVNMPNTPFPAEIMAAKPALPNLHRAPPAPVAAPKAALSHRVLPVSPILPAVPPPNAQQAEKPAAPPAPDIARIPVRGSDREGLVVLSPMAVPPAPALNVPLAEARGRFVISPDASIATFQPGAGSESGAAPSSVSSAGSRTDADSGNAAARKGEESNNPGTPAGNTVVRPGDKAGMGEGSLPGNSGTGNGSGRGSASGPGLGSKAGHSAGSGAGAGYGPGSGAFAGITIQGSASITGSLAHQNVRMIQPGMSYNITVESTASSGGGLGDYGVFSNEKVYTVYLDMRRTPQDPVSAWTLQYAPLPEASGIAALRSPQSQTELAAPIPVVKPIPRLPANAQQGLVVISATMGQDGKLAHMAVKRSPDKRLVESLLATLAQWVFRPAELNGHPIAVKLLLGIPVAHLQ